MGGTDTYKLVGHYISSGSAHGRKVYKYEDNREVYFYITPSSNRKHIVHHWRVKPLEKHWKTMLESK
jgi:hypothetical protein